MKFLSNISNDNIVKVIKICLITLLVFGIWGMFITKQFYLGSDFESKFFISKVFFNIRGYYIIFYGYIRVLISAVLIAFGCEALKRLLNSK